ncbi:General transcription factor II-I repeat domain containing protein 2 [Dissostichus eleginoides]|uniref:General transcription factor II-I repeat domain containing protein 2 n=1 Tax=Dissostichus eleginoides TaxID=100907 RepID=A0AAD9BQ47_DISEL|nr:General transcription factor II-I repeat domain containing protein 2 [Dissostichus eleginoides]
MLNELNLELQGKDRTVVDMISSVNAFKRRLHLLCSKLQRKDLANFQNIASELEKQGKDSALLDSARYTEQVNNITSDFEKRFRDFALLEPCATFMCYPFSEDHDIDSLAQYMGAVFHLNPSALEDEMSLQADIQLKAHAHAGQFWNLFRVEKYPNVRKYGEDDEDLLRGGEPTATRQIHEGGPIRHSSGGEEQARVEQSGEDKRENEDTGELDDPYSTDPGLWGNNMDEQGVSAALQAVELDLCNAVDLVRSLREYVAGLRDQFDNFETAAKNMSPTVSEEYRADTQRKEKKKG